MDNKQRLSVIVPALNEEDNISSAVASVLEAMDGFNISGEVIVVNDGSTDKTRPIVEEIIKKNSRVRILNHERPWGIGGAFWDGVDNASGDIVLMIPGDNETDPGDILRYFKLIEDVDIVIPFFFNQEVRPLFRRILSWVYRAVVNFTFLIHFNYTNGTIIYRKSILKQLPSRSYGFFFQADILVRFARKGYLFAEVPCRLLIRKSGESKAVSFPSLMKVIKAYFCLVWDYYFSGRDRAVGKKGFTQDSVTLKRRATL